jgi:hypothetical protein
LYLGLGCKMAQAVYVVLHDLVDRKTGSAQIHMWKALLVKLNSKMTSVVKRIRHCLYDKKGCKRVWLLTIWVDHVVEDYKPLNFNLYDEDVQYPVLIRLQFECTNNMIEYDMCIISLEATLELKVGKLYSGHL